ncbi:MAG: S8 family serine peptidase [Bifidobacteriaceae bacterium]|jgi:subtilisin family serine protease|nr:S8 family serine peptidase [Bifidobacteriaceae bacterium]
MPCLLRHHRLFGAALVGLLLPVNPLPNTSVSSGVTWSISQRSGSGVGPQTDPTAADVKPQEIVALVKPGVSAQTVRRCLVKAAKAAHTSARFVKPPGKHPARATVIMQARQAKRLIKHLVNSGVFSAVDYQIKAHVDYSTKPNDPLFAIDQSWAWHSSAGAGFDQAWPLLSGQAVDGQQVPIAVVDTGFSMDHPDRGNNIVSGWDYGQNRAAVTPSLRSPDSEHGTGTAGIIGAQTDNATGGAGAAWDSRVIVYKAADAAGTLQFSAISDAILAAGRAGVRVINLSLGASQFPSYLQKAIDQVVDQGIVVVASAGNQAQTTLAGVANPAQYPAAYSRVVSVAAFDQTGKWASFSTHNSQVDIAAPGVGILVMDHQFPGGYASADGTSQAAPLVSAAVALMLRMNPHLTPDQVKLLLCQSAKDITIPPARTGKDEYTGCGALNVVGALEQAVLTGKAPTVVPAASELTVVAGDQVNLALTTIGWPMPSLLLDPNTPTPKGVKLLDLGAHNWVLRGQAIEAGVFPIRLIARSGQATASTVLTITVKHGQAAQLRALTELSAMRNTDHLVLHTAITDVWGNYVREVAPNSANSVVLHFSVGKGCRFPSGQAPSYRLCRITPRYNGPMPAKATVIRVYDARALQIRLHGQIAPGKRLTAHTPANWPNLQYQWRIGRQLIKGATGRTIKIPRTATAGSHIKVQVSVVGTNLRKHAKTAPLPKATKNQPRTVKGR